MPEVPGLPALEEALARDLERLNHPPAEWIPVTPGPDGRPMSDVAIIGAGMNGLAAAFALRRLGIARIRHLDRSPEGREGPWVTYARMQTLRSPKHLTGPAMGIPNLTFRAWYEAERGVDAWHGLGRIPRVMWMDYLRWYRRVTGAEIENRVEVLTLSPQPECTVLILRHSDGRHETLHSRQVVVATGREGQAAPRIPDVLRPYFGTAVLHASDEINFAKLAGKRVAVVGLAASAFDNAAEALEAGAAEVTLIGRSSALPRLNKMKQTVYPGFTQGFPALPDTEKLRILAHVAGWRIAPPRDSVLRLAADPRMRLMLGADLRAAAPQGAGLRLEMAVGAVDADLVILGTGFAVDLDAPPELASCADRILRWADKVPEALGEWGAFPYLGAGFEFREREAGAASGLGRIRCFTHAAQLSLGNLSNDVPATSEGAQRLAEAIARSLFFEDRDAHWRALERYGEPELIGDEWPGLVDWSPPIDG